MKNCVTRIAGKPAPTPKTACPTPACTCRSELARDVRDAVYLKNRVTRIAGKPAPTTKKSMRISYLKSAYGINGCTGIGKLPCQVSNVYRR